MFQKIHAIQQVIERKMQKEDSFFIRILLTPVLFFVFLIHAILYSVSVLFFPTHKSFQHMHNIHPNDAEEQRVIEHTAWSKKVRKRSMGSLIASIAITSLIVSAFAGKLPTFAATDCTLDIDVETSPINVDTYIASQGGCDNLSVLSGSGSGTATLQFTDDQIDLSSGGTLLIDSGVTVVFSGALNFPTGNIENNGTITHSEGDKIGLTISTETIVNNGTIDVTGKGCQAVSTQRGYGPDSSGTCVVDGAGAGTGSTSTGGGSGAAHGGYGGDSNQNSNDSYDSNIRPALLGASGSSVNRGAGVYGGHGGGLVQITAIDTFENNGTISANGDGSDRATGSGGSSLYGASGGAGGSIYIMADIIDTSSGSLSVNGGDGDTNTSSRPGGGGGGGRIAFHYTSSSNIDESSVTATGGNGGVTSSGNNTAEDGQSGSVVVVNDTDDEMEIYSGFTFGVSGENMGSVDNPIDSLVINENADALYCDINATNVEIIADDIEWDGSLVCDKGGLENFSITANNNLEFLPGTVITFADEETVFAVDSPSDLTFDTVSITGALEGMWNMNDDINVTITNNSVIHSNIQWFIDEFHIDSGATLSADNIGCRASRMDSIIFENDLLVQRDSFGPNSSNICVDPNDDDGIGGVPWPTEGYFGADGAGYASVGGNGSGGFGLAGQSYGSELRPDQFGSGGGTSGHTTTGQDRMAQGGHGGGLILIQALDSMTLDGDIHANGDIGETTGLELGTDPDSAGGGGSGGTVRLVTTDCSRTGNITANGGAGATDNTAQAGGGSGGRVRLAPVNSGDCENSLDNTAADGGAAGGGSATDGGDGTGHSELLNVPTTPEITFPYPESYNVSLNPLIETTAYSDNGGFKLSHSIEITREDTGNTVWETGTVDSSDESGLSLQVDTSNGTFSDGLTQLEYETRYCITATYTNLAGDGTSQPTCFQTEYRPITLNAQVTYNWTYEEIAQYVYNAVHVALSSGIASLVNQGGSTYTSGNYSDVEVDASAFLTAADFWYTITETLGSGNAGSVRYQIGNDTNNDNVIDTWNYVDYSGFESDHVTVPTWTEATGTPNANNTNSVEELNYYAPAWTIAAAKTGDLTMRGFLISTGSQPVEVDTTTVVVSNNDADGDGYDTVDSGGNDCNDNDAAIHPDAEEIWYDGIDQNCDGLDDYDQDQDGYTPNEYENESPLPAGDCNDTDASVNPGATETYYDGIDQNCDGLDDYDQDQDGYTPNEYENESPLPAGDCNDTDASVNPGAEDIFYDGVDSNCDGLSDFDADQDSYDSDSFGGDDCNDADAAINPGANEIYYDGVDQNCDGESDFDADEDSYDSDSFGGDDCNDADAATHPGAFDAIVDGVDLDCDGFDGPDEDGDGFAPDDAGGNDCNDTDSTIFPGAFDVEDDGIDQNCDGVDGEGQDNDNDGFTGEEIGGVDCDDTNPLVFPASEDQTRNALDENCDGVDGPFIVDHVTGTESGAGIVTVYAPDNSVHYTYEAFRNGGVYPVLIEHENRYFVAEVKFQLGKMLRVHELHPPRLGGAELLTQRRISIKRKFRRLAFGEMGRTRELHIVLSTTRGNVQTGQARRIKIIRFNPNRAQMVRPMRNQFYRMRKARMNIGNRVSIVRRTIIVIRNNQNKIVFLWNPRIR